MIELIALIIGATITSLIALIVFAKNNRSITNRIFLILTVGLVGWSLTTYLSLHTSTDIQTLFWIRWIMWGNKYAAIFISLLVTAGMVYALTRKYQGIYTTVFAVIGSVLFLGYIILEFWKLGKK